MIGIESILSDAREVLPSAFTEAHLGERHEKQRELYGAVEMHWETDPDTLRAAIRHSEYFRFPLPESRDYFSRADYGDASEAEAAHHELGFDIFAFYVSFHTVDHLSRWGIFFYEEGIRRLSLLLMRETGISSSDARDIAFKLLRAHERFHFRFDLGTLYDELVLKTPLYNQYTSAVYQTVICTSNCFEESLANQVVASARFNNPESQAIASFTKDFLRDSPPGYRDFDQDPSEMRERLLLITV